MKGQARDLRIRGQARKQQGQLRPKSRPPKMPPAKSGRKG